MDGERMPQVGDYVQYEGDFECYRDKRGRVVDLPAHGYATVDFFGYSKPDGCDGYYVMCYVPHLTYLILTEDDDAN